MQNTNIQWTDHTWNIARGCTKVNSDCKFCYMMRNSLNGTRYAPMKVTRTKGAFNFPLRIPAGISNVWRGSQLVFTSSLTDVFHPDIDGYRDEMWDIIEKRGDLTFQILTKRPERILGHIPDDSYAPGCKFGEHFANVWLGFSAGTQGAFDVMAEHMRIVHNRVHPTVTFASLEPMTEWMLLSRHLDILDWVIVGGESGNDTGKWGYRPCEADWIISIIEQCRSHNVPVFVKQLGTHLAKKMGLSDRHGGDMWEWPKELRVREFPKP